MLFTATLLLSNFSYFHKILLKDPKELEFLEIERDIVRLRVSQLYISSFHSYGLGKVLFIRSKGKRTSFSDRIEAVLGKIPRDKPTFLIVLYPTDESRQKAKSEFPNAKLIKNYKSHSLYKTG